MPNIEDDIYMDDIVCIEMNYNSIQLSKIHFRCLLLSIMVYTTSFFIFYIGFYMLYIYYRLIIPYTILIFILICLIFSEERLHLEYNNKIIHLVLLLVYAFIYNYIDVKNT